MLHLPTWQVALDVCARTTMSRRCLCAPCWAVEWFWFSKMGMLAGPLVSRGPLPAAPRSRGARDQQGDADLPVLLLVPRGEVCKIGDLKHRAQWGRPSSLRCPISPLLRPPLRCRPWRSGPATPRPSATASTGGQPNPHRGSFDFDTREIAGGEPPGREPVDVWAVNAPETPPPGHLGHFLHSQGREPTCIEKRSGLQLPVCSQQCVCDWTGRQESLKALEATCWAEVRQGEPRSS